MIRVFCWKVPKRPTYIVVAGEPLNLRGVALAGFLSVVLLCLMGYALKRPLTDHMVLYAALKEASVSTELQETKHNLHVAQAQLRALHLAKNERAAKVPPVYPADVPEHRYSCVSHTEGAHGVRMFCYRQMP